MSSTRETHLAVSAPRLTPDTLHTVMTRLGRHPLVNRRLSAKIKASPVARATRIDVPAG